MAKIVHVRVTMNHQGARALLNDDGVFRDLVRRGELIADAAGGAPNFEVLAHQGGPRARVSVITATYAARIAEARQRALSNALRAGRG